jgi:hypothetical protein
MGLPVTTERSSLARVWEAGAALPRLPWGAGTGGQIVDAAGFPVDLTDIRARDALLEWFSTVEGMIDGFDHDAEEARNTVQRLERDALAATGEIEGLKVDLRQANEELANLERGNGIPQERERTWLAWAAWSDADEALRASGTKGRKLKAELELARVREENSRLATKLAALEGFDGDEPPPPPAEGEWWKNEKSSPRVPSGAAAPDASPRGKADASVGARAPTRRSSTPDASARSAADASVPPAAWSFPKGETLATWREPPPGAPLTRNELHLVGIIVAARAELDRLQGELGDAANAEEVAMAARDAAVKESALTKGLVVEVSERARTEGERAAAHAETLTKNLAAARARLEELARQNDEVTAQLHAAEDALAVAGKSDTGGTDTAGFLAYVANAEESLRMLRERVTQQAGRAPGQKGGAG